MISERENELLTRIGPGTPMGDLQRRYWHVVGGIAEIAGRSTKRVRLLGEDFALSRDRSGRLGLIAGGAAAQDRKGYPVEELGGLIWAYLGPQPAPLLPRWDGFVGKNVIRLCAWNVVNCNWLQIMENSVDPVHTEWLHGALLEFIEEKNGNSTRLHISRKHLKIDFTEFEYGVYKRRLLEGAPEDSDDWRVGHPVLFPNILAVGSGGGQLWKVHSYQIRVPIDDERTMHYWYAAYEPPAGVDVPRHLLERVDYYEMPVRDAAGEFLLDIVNNQDIMAWETQGTIAKRHLERLGTTDVGVILYRSMLKRELEKIAAGQDPLGTVRDPAKNTVITFPLERNKAHLTDGFDKMLHYSPVRYSSIKDDLCKVFAEYNSDRLKNLLPDPRQLAPAK